MENSTRSFRQIIREATLSDVILIIGLIFVILVIPVYNVYSGELKCGGEILDNKPWWLYLLAIWVWNTFIIVVLITISGLGVIFGKIGQWVYDNKK